MLWWKTSQKSSLKRTASQPGRRDDRCWGGATEIQGKKRHKHTETIGLWTIYHKWAISNICVINDSTQNLIESADNERSRLLLEKAEAEDLKRKAEAELQGFMDSEEKLSNQFKRDFQEVQVNTG